MAEHSRQHMAHLNQITDTNRRNVQVALVCGLVVAGMVGLSFAAVPLYNLFCRVTGYGGTTSAVEEITGPIIDRQVTVRFDASLARGMPWKFEPMQISQELKVGETAMAYYRVVNPTNRTIAGTATYNVTPQKAGSYFAKLECFCFTEQILEPGQSAELPVTYFVDPEIDNDPYMDDIKTLTLSYTFFEMDDVDGESVAKASR